MYISWIFIIIAAIWIISLNIKRAGLTNKIRITNIVRRGEAHAIKMYLRNSLTLKNDDDFYFVLSLVTNLLTAGDHELGYREKKPPSLLAEDLGLHESDLVSPDYEKKIAISLANYLGYKPKRKGFEEHFAPLDLFED